MFNKLDFSKTYTQTWAKQSANLLMADVVGTMSEAFVVANMGKLERNFPQTTGFICDMINVPMHYLQEPIEKLLEHTKNFEGRDNYDKRMEKGKQERAHGYAEGVFHYGAALGVGWLTTVGTERYVLSKVFKTPEVPLHFYGCDGLMHLGLIAMMGTPLVRPATEKAKDVVRAVSGALGADDHQAEDISRLAVVTAIPNYAVFGAISQQLYTHNKTGTSQLTELAKILNIGGINNSHHV